MYISIYTFRIKTYIYGLITQECTLVHNGVGVVRQAGKAHWPALWNICMLASQAITWKLLCITVLGPHLHYE